MDSQTSALQLQAFFGERSQAWRDIEDSNGLPPGDPRPPFHIRRVSLLDYDHLGTRGELVLEFFNDRLMSTRFYPVDLAGYLRRLQAEVPSLTSDTAAELPPYTKVRIGVDYWDRGFVVWEDRRLVDELSLWIKLYS
ncbi:MAG: hypothetical protein LC667_17885 [Thioalkalivibrio sp.]|nr:hypothetical protein [Thioalkalivibrio sp.]